MVLLWVNDMTDSPFQSEISTAEKPGPPTACYFCKAGVRSCGCEWLVAGRASPDCRSESPWWKVTKCVLAFLPLLVDIYACFLVKTAAPAFTQHPFLSGSVPRASYLRTQWLNTSSVREVFFCDWLSEIEVPWNWQRPWCWMLYPLINKCFSECS